VLAVEIDTKLEEQLRRRFDHLENFTLLMGDALESKHQLGDFLIEALNNWGPYSFVSNLPYAAGTPILMNLWQSEVAPEKALVMLQKEVGQRITAEVNTKAYGSLTVLLANVCDSSYVAKIPPHCFSPPPKVDSCLIKMKAHKRQVRPDKLQVLVKLAFGQRRKQLGKRLEKAGFLLEKCDVKPTDRAENMTVQQFFCLVKDQSCLE
jgi:16S rRNA (adenine1518-N6/adenine1519-N6)-dimethyltransferase